jgi:hypothetical protein
MIDNKRDTFNLAGTHIAANSQELNKQPQVGRQHLV